MQRRDQIPDILSGGSSLVIADDGLGELSSQPYNGLGAQLQDYPGPQSLQVSRPRSTGRRHDRQRSEDLTEPLRSRRFCLACHGSGDLGPSREHTRISTRSRIPRDRRRRKQRRLDSAPPGRPSGLP